MNKTDIGLIETQIEAIKNAENTKEENELILNTMKILLECVDYTDDTLSQYESLEIRKLFSSFCKVSTVTCNFFESSKNHLDPQALNGKLGTELENTTQKVIEISKLIDEIETKDALLLQKREELYSIKNKYDELSGKVEELKVIEQTVSADVIENLHNAIIETQEIISNNTAIVEELKEKLAKETQSKNDLDNIKVSLNSQLNEIETNIIEKIDSNIELVNSLYKERGQDIEMIKDRINQTITDFSNLDNRCQQYKEYYNECLIHFGENSEIFSKVKSMGYDSIKSYVDHINSLIDEIDRNLKKYDNLIREIIEVDEQKREELKRLQNKRI